MPTRAASARSHLAALPAAAHLVRRRVRLQDGLRTTLYVAEYDRASTAMRVVRLGKPAPLAAWCAARGVEEAIVGGFFTRPAGEPLGELRTRGVRRRSVPFDAPWDGVRSCVHVVGGAPGIARRHHLPAQPRGDVLQAGPLLVDGGEPVIASDGDVEGFSAGSHQFDSDITAGRYPRAALALSEDRIFAVACDGRSRTEAGLRLDELAQLLVELGAGEAINLDGGGSTSLVCAGQLRNRPRAQFGVPIPGGRPVATALVFERRAS